MYPASDTALDPRDTVLGLALAKVQGDSDYRLFVSAQGTKIVDRQPYPDLLDPTGKTINQNDRGSVGGTAWADTPTWFEATDEFIVWFLAGVFSQMRIPTNAFLNDHINAPLGGGMNSWVNPEYNNFAQNPQTSWKLFPVLSDAINDSNVGMQGSDGPNYIDVSLSCIANNYAGLDRGPGGHRLVAVLCNLLKLARCCHFDAPEFTGLSIAFKPTVVGVHATFEVELAYDRSGQRARETVTPRVLFVRILDALLGRYRYPETFRSIPYCCRLRFDYALNEIVGQQAAVRGTDPNDHRAWVDSSITESMDTTYLTRLVSGGIFMPPIGYTDGQNSTQTSNPWMLVPVPRANGTAPSSAGFHAWWAALNASSVAGSVWAQVIASIERSLVAAVLPAIVDYDYIRFHVDLDVPTPSVDLDPVLDAISQAVSDVTGAITQQTADVNAFTDSKGDGVRSSLTADIASQTTAINSHTDSQVASQSQALQEHITSTAGGTNAAVGAAAASIHQGMASKTGEILAAISAIPEGENTAAKLNEIISRQQADTGVVTAVCLAALRKLLSPKRFNQVIEQLSSIEYRPVRVLRPGEDVTAGETGPLSPYLEIFDKFGRPRAESNQ